MDVDIENKWVSMINKEYVTDKRKRLSKKEIIELKNTAITTTQIINGKEFSEIDIKAAKKIINIYKIPDHYIAYIDGDEEGDKVEFTKNDVIFYVVDDSLDIVELILNEYYTNYIYLIPKIYLKVDQNNYYKILNYKKLFLTSKNDRNYKRIEVCDKDTFIKQSHRFIFEKIILNRK